MRYDPAKSRISFFNGLVVALLLGLTGCASNMVQPEEAVNTTSSVELLQKEADQLYRNKAYDDALVKYVSIINADPQNEHAFVQIGLIHDHMQNYTLSSKAFNSALSINGDNILAREGVGISLARQGFRDDAKIILEQLIVEHPDRWKAHNSLGVLYDMERNHSKALSSFNLALKYNQNDAEILNNIGYSYYLRGDRKLAEEYFLRSIKANNSFDKAWANLGLLYARETKFEESVIAFSNVMETHEAYNQVGYLSMLSGEYAASELHLKKAILIAPFYYEAAHKNLGRLKILRASL